MEQKLIHKSDVWTAPINKIEIASNFSRAVLTIPLMHVGPNKKGLYWTENMLKEIVLLFQNTTFRYDLEGKEGSSHTINKLSSPHFDVGWTYNGDEGAWYESESKALWIKGEVTHPDVIRKLERRTTDGKSEVNYASMGIIVEEAKCSICGGDYNELCENGHERNKEYDGMICYKVPVKCSKGLHVALTNDAADGEAEIKECIFQELGYQMTPQNDERSQAGNQMEKSQLNNQIPGGLAPSSPQTAQPGIAPSSEVILRDLAERVKTLENSGIGETPELVNAAPQDQLMQDNMGVTSQFDQPTEVGKIDPNIQAPVNPPAETQDNGIGQIMQMLQQILQAVTTKSETQDMGKEALSVNKGAIKHDETKPTEHAAPGDAVPDSKSDSNKKNEENMTDGSKVATADDSTEEKEKEKEKESSESDLQKEVADMKAEMVAMRQKMEIQDNVVPEFGGAPAAMEKVDVADMSADDRAQTFGDFGKFDAIFNGANSAEKFRRAK